MAVRARPVSRIGVVVRDGVRSREVLTEVIAAAKPLGLSIAVEPIALEDAPAGTSTYTDPTEVDAVVSLGGDGTLLRAARALVGTATPLLGVNVGDLGFLTQASLHEIEPTLERLASGSFGIEKRFTLAVETGIAGEAHRALNEVVVNKAGVARVARLELFVGDG